MSPPNPNSSPLNAGKQQQQAAGAGAAANSNKLNQINYSIQNYIKELEISEGQLSSVLKLLSVFSYFCFDFDFFLFKNLNY